MVVVKIGLVVSGHTRSRLVHKLVLGLVKMYWAINEKVFVGYREYDSEAAKLVAELKQELAIHASTPEDLVEWSDALIVILVDGQIQDSVLDIVQRAVEQKKQLHIYQVDVERGVVMKLQLDEVLASPNSSS